MFRAGAAFGSKAVQRATKLIDKGRRLRKSRQPAARFGTSGRGATISLSNSSLSNSWLWCKNKGGRRKARLGQPAKPFSGERHAARLHASGA